MNAWWLLLPLVLLVGWLIAVFNRLVALRNRLQNAFSQIDVQLLRRHDLIPNLVEAVKGYLAHERNVLESVARLRGEAREAASAAQGKPASADTVRQVSEAEDRLNRGLTQLYAVSENYPELKGDTTVRQLMEELASAENRIAFARQAYNDAVMRMNTAVQSFPANLVAGPFGFQAGAFFEAEPPAREAVKVSLGAGG